MPFRTQPKFGLNQASPIGAPATSPSSSGSQVGSMAYHKPGRPQTGQQLTPPTHETPVQQQPWQMNTGKGHYNANPVTATPVGQPQWQSNLGETIFNPSDTQLQINQAASNAFTQSDPRAAMKPFQRPGLSNDAGTLFSAIPKIAS